MAQEFVLPFSQLLHVKLKLYQQMKEQLVAPDSGSSSESCGEEEGKEEISVTSLKKKEVDFLQRSVIIIFLESRHKNTG